MKFPLSPEDFETWKQASRAESERLKALRAKADAVTPEEREQRRERQRATDKANDKRRREAREAAIESKAHSILKSRLRLLAALSTLLHEVPRPKLVDALVYHRAYKQPEWTRAGKYAKEQKNLDQYAVDEPLDVDDISLLVSVLTDEWTEIGEIKPLTIHQALEKVAPLCKQHNVERPKVRANLELGEGYK